MVGIGLRPEARRSSQCEQIALRSQKQSEHLLPVRSILQVYDNASQELLILAEPGAGKSTLLVDLAQRLVERAEQDNEVPLPVILPLSSWAIKRPTLQEWLIEQLITGLRSPKQVAAHWVQEEQILPLLDGLDEMEETARPACIAAINTYHQDHLVPLVVASRQSEYEVVAEHERLALQSAVVVQPLTREQVDDYLDRAGKPLNALKSALKRNSSLRELATTPLWLNVMMLAYYGIPVRRLSKDAIQLQQQVLMDYVQRMVERKGNCKRYPLQQTYLRLGWLARQLQMHNQAIFYSEHLRFDWLSATQQRIYTWLAIWLPSILIGMLASLVVGLLFNKGTISLVFLLQFGILGGFLAGYFSQGVHPEYSSFDRAAQPNKNILYRGLICIVISAMIGLVLGLSLGPSINLAQGPEDWLLDGRIYGIIIGLSCCCLLFLPTLHSSRKTHKNSTKKRRSWSYLLSTLYVRRALLVATILGGGMGLSYGISTGFKTFQTSQVCGDVCVPAVNEALSGGISIGLSEWVSYGLYFALISLLVSLILNRFSGNIHLAERLHWTWRGLFRSLVTSKHVSISVSLIGLILLLTGLSIAISTGLDYALGFVMAAWLLGIDNHWSTALPVWVVLGLVMD